MMTVMTTKATAARLTVNFDPDLAFIVTSLGVHLSSARVLAVVSHCDVADVETVLLVEAVSTAIYNDHAT